MINTKTVDVKCSKLKGDQITYTNNIGTRQNQEDSILFAGRETKPGYIIGVSDGMGGAQDGDKASEIVARTFETWYNEESNEVLNNKKKILKSLKEISYVAKESIQKNLSAGAGATLSCAIVNKYNDFVTMVNVGDSRGYIFDKNKGLYLITNDHTINFDDYFVNKPKTVEALDKYMYYTTNEIYSCFNGELNSMQIDMFTLERMPDALLFATDGLVDVVSSTIIQTYLKAYNNDCSTVGRLCELAITGKDDNFSVDSTRIKNNNVDNVSIIMSSKDKGRSLVR